MACGKESGKMPSVCEGVLVYIVVNVVNKDATKFVVYQFIDVLYLASFTHPMCCAPATS